MKKLLLALFFTIVIVPPANAQSTLAQQKQCAEGAEKFISSLNDVFAYTCHYNKKLDRCFIRVGFWFGPVEEKVELGNGKTTAIKHPDVGVALYDVFDNKLIGNCTYIGSEKQDCWIGNKKCNTRDEFENLIKPYMEE